MQAWHQHERELRAWLRSRLDEPDVCEDLMQDTFIKALRQGSRFCDVDNARAWLFEVTRNALVDHWRQHRPSEPLDEAWPAIEPDAPPPVDSLVTCLPRVLEELSDADRDAITHCDLQGMSQEDYARHLGISLPGAKSRIQRARKRLRAQLMASCKVVLDAQGAVCCFTPRAQPQASSAQACASSSSPRKSPGSSR